MRKNTAKWISYLLIGLSAGFLGMGIRLQAETIASLPQCHWNIEDSEGNGLFLRQFNVTWNEDGESECQQMSRLCIQQQYKTEDYVKGLECIWQPIAKYQKGGECNCYVK